MIKDSKPETFLRGGTEDGLKAARRTPCLGLGKRECECRRRGSAKENQVLGLE